MGVDAQIEKVRLFTFRSTKGLSYAATQKIQSPRFLRQRVDVPIQSPNRGLPTLQ
jgi:hypothetical protein